MIAAVVIKIVASIVSLTLTGGAIAYIYFDNTLGSSNSSENISGISSGFQYYVTSALAEDKETPYSEIPSDFASITDDDHSYACKIDVITSYETIYGESKTEESSFVDHTCALYALENFGKDGSKTLNLPANIESSKLLRSRSSIDESSHQLLRLNKKFLQRMPRGGTTISIIDKRSKYKTYMKLKLEFLFSAEEERKIPSSLFSVWIKHKNPRHSKITTSTFDANTKFNCLIGLNGTKIPCKLYKYSTQKTTSNITHTDLKTLSHITDYANDLTEGAYYALDLLGNKKTYGEIANSYIGLYEDIDANSDVETLSLVYDRPLFGRYTQPNEHNIYTKTPDKTVFLAKKSKDSETNKLATPDIDGSTQNYRCKVEEVPTLTTNNKVANFDDSCKLYSFEALTGSKKSRALTHTDFTSATTLATKTKLDSDIFFKLELDTANLFNLDFDPKKPHIPKIKLVEKVKVLTSTDQTDDTTKEKPKHFIELELVQELNKVTNKFEGKSQLLLVQVLGTAKQFKAKDGNPVKCKFFEGSASFDCDIYSIKSQSTTLKDVGNKDALDEIDLLKATKLDFSEEHTYRQKHHYIVDIKTPTSLQELLGKKHYFYIYQEGHADPLPGQPTFAAKEKATKNTTSGTDSITPVQSAPVSQTPATKIIFYTLKVLEADLSSDKAPIFFN